MKIMDIFGALKKDMDFIEQQLYRSIDGDDGILSETSLHLLKAGEAAAAGVRAARRQVRQLRSAAAAIYRRSAGADPFGIARA